MEMDAHCVSVIIPTIGRGTLEACKEALHNQRRPADEIIIVKDMNRRGAAWARNEGIRRSRGDLIAFLDDDCIPPMDWIECLVHAIDAHNAAGAGGTYIEVDPLLHDIRVRRRFPEKEVVDVDGFVGAGGNVMYRRCWLDVLAQSDGHIFNEVFRVSQDIELAWRLRILGGKLIFVPAKVTHLRRVTGLEYFRHQFLRGTGIARLDRIQRTYGGAIVLQKSLLWDPIGRGKVMRWVLAAWYKGLGPFDMKCFRTRRSFVIFWTGEKFQAAGFFAAAACLSFRDALRRLGL